jgi:penicillin-binding protein 1A
VEKSRLKNVLDQVNPTDPAQVNEPGPDAYLVMLREKRIPQVAGLGSPVQGDSVVSPQIAFLMTYMMQGVIQRGTGAAASALGRPLAGKTGTTNDFRDGWFVGFSPEIITGVWVGYDDYRVSLGEGNAGARVALPAWMNFMKTALSSRPMVDFPVPGNIEFARIDQKTGLLANSCTEKSVMEAFIAGTVPAEYSNCGAIPPSDDLIQRLDY